MVILIVFRNFELVLNWIIELNLLLFGQLKRSISICCREMTFYACNTLELDMVYALQAQLHCDIILSLFFFFLFEFRWSIWVWNMGWLIALGCICGFAFSFHGAICLICDNWAPSLGPKTTSRISSTKKQTTRTLLGPLVKS